MAGLLSDPEKRKQLFALISKRQVYISILLFFGGIVAFAVLSHVNFAQKTYFSENALLPGVVDELFASNDRKVAMELMQEVSRFYEKTTNGVEPDISHWLYEKLEDFGLEAYEQSFEVSFSSHKYHSGKSFYGTNTYGILRAPRSAGHEGIAVVAPIYTTGPYTQSNTAGIGLFLALAKFFSNKNFWSRDVAFIVPSMDYFGLQAWLNAYSASLISEDTEATVSVDNHYVNILSSPLKARCGALQAALILELGPKPNPPRVDLRLEGVNGLLPNLDYFNLVVRVAEKHGITVSLMNRTDAKNPDTTNGYFQSMKTMFKQMGALAKFSPTGLHGLFLPLRVEALTMSAEPPRPSKRMINSAPDIIAIGRLLEATVRAVNNLQERFHQSFFFYLLPNTHFFLSIGPYMGAFGAILAAPLLHALSLWIGTRSSDSASNASDMPPISPVWPYLIVCMSIGAICFQFIPRLWYTSVEKFDLSPGHGILMSLGSLCFALSVFLPQSRLFKEGTVAGFPDWRLAKSVSILFMSLMLGALGLINISFAFFSAILLILATLFSKPSNSRLVRIFRSAMIFIIASPFTLAAVLCCLHPVLTEATFIDQMGAMFANALNDHFVHGSHFWTAFTLAYLPAWLFTTFIPFLPLLKEVGERSPKSKDNSAENSE